MANYTSAFTAQTTVTVAGTTHLLLTSNLLAAVYDNASPAVLIQPGRITVDATTNDVVVTFRQAQSGKLVLCGAKPISATIGNFAQPFTTQTSVTITGAAHGLGTSNLIIAVYDTASPALRITPGRVTVDPTTFDVVVTFRQAQSGTIILCGSQGTSVSLNVSSAFTAQTSVTVTGATHGLGTKNLLVAVYDNASPARLIEPGRVTVDPTTFDVVVTFRQAQSGILILNGSMQAPTLAVAPTESLTVGETITPNVLLFPAVLTEALTLGDTVARMLLPFLQVIEALTLGESLSQQVLVFPQIANEALTLGETVTPRLLAFPAVLTEAVTVGETVSVAVLMVTVSEALTIGESRGAQLLVFPQVTDALTLGETIARMLLVFPTVLTEGLSVGELLVVPSIAPDVLNVAQPFTAQTSVTIPGTSHNAGHANLLVAVYDTQSPAHLMHPGRVTVDPTTFDVVVTFAQAQSGTIVLNGARPTQTLHGNTRKIFTTATTVTVTNAEHGFGSSNLLVQVYDAQSPAHRIDPGQVTVHPTTFDVVVTFAQAQSGTVIVSAYALTGETTNVAQPFTAQTSVTIPGATHALATSNLLAQVYDTQSPAHLLTPASLTVDSTTFDVVVTFVQAQSGTIVLNGSAHAAVYQIAVADTLAMSEVVNLFRPLLIVSTIPTDAVTIGEVRTVTRIGPEAVNLAQAFTTQTSVTITGASHNAGHANLLVAVYDTQSPAHLIEADIVTVHPTTFDVVVTFAQAQSGTIVLNGARPTQTLHGNTTKTFASATSVTITNAEHGLGTSALLVAVYDTQSPAALIEPDAITVDPTTFAVVVTFATAQSGTIILCAYGLTGLAANLATPFTAQTTITIPGTTHALATSNLLLQAYDAQSPAHLITPESVTVDATTFDVVVTFAAAQSGTLVLNGSMHMAVAQIAVTDALLLGETVSNAILTVSIVEALTVGEIVTPQLPFVALSISDTLTVSDNISRQLLAFPQVLNEGLTVGDVVIQQLLVFPQVTEPLTIGETVVLTSSSLLSPSLIESLIVGDVVTLTVSFAALLLSEPLTVGESVTANLLVFAGITETVTTGESTTLLMPILSLQGLEGVTVGETVVLTSSSLFAFTIADALTVSESVVLRLPVLPSTATDALTFGESTALSLFLFPAVIDGVTVTEALLTAGTLSLAVVDGLALTETTPLALALLALAVTETLGVGESTSGSLPFVAVSVFDAVLSGESLAVLQTQAGQVAVLEPIALADTTTLRIPVVLLTIQEAVTSGEATILLALLQPPLLAEPVTLGENVSCSLLSTVFIVETTAVSEILITALVFFSTSVESLTLGESTTLLIPLLPIAVVETAITGDIVLVTTTGTYAQFVMETLAVGELTSLRLPFLLCLVSEDLSLAEITIMPGLILLTSSTDTILLGETMVTGLPFLAMTLTDVVMLADTLAVTWTSSLLIPEALTVSEFLGVSLLAFIQALDPVTAGDITAPHVLAQPQVIEALTIGDALGFVSTLQCSILEILSAGEAGNTHFRILARTMAGTGDTLTPGRTAVGRLT